MKDLLSRGAWVAQSVKRLTSAQVMISWFVSLSPASGSLLTAWSLEPSLGSVSPSLYAPPPLVLYLSKINKCKKNLKRKKDLHSENYKILMKEIKDDTKK